MSIGKDSLPHISLLQFSSEANNQLLDDVKEWVLIHNKLLYPEFLSLNINTLHGEFSGRYSADLNIARQEDLLNIQSKCLEFAKKNRLQPLNTQGNLYRPHLTLAMFSPQDSISIPKMPNHLLGISAHPFYLKLGLADDNWQCIDIL